jgi:hypothetical protein
MAGPAVALMATTSGVDRRSPVGFVLLNDHYLSNHYSPAAEQGTAILG